MAKVTIDGIEVEVPDGTSILNAARMIGGDVVPPAMCYYSSLKRDRREVSRVFGESNTGLC
jgi:NADH-quinone oxidoreductase subunit G